MLERANRFVDPPLAVDEVRRYDRSDARMWERRRRIDSFLLPARIER